LDIDITVKMIKAAIEARVNLFDTAHESAFRLFNGFFEGCPELVVDLYGTTLLIYDHGAPIEKSETGLQAIQSSLLDALPWVKTVVVKRRNSEDAQDQRGRVAFGGPPDQKIHEQGVWYAVDLLINRDASFYLDTRNLRSWILSHLRGKTVLNAFAYTGSLGVAARAAGAQRVVQLDRNRTFLSLAAESYRLNALPVDRKDFLVGDFFSQTSRMRRTGMSFDCVLIDPPFFSVTSKGRVDLIGEGQRLINKVRPLVNHEGWLITVNNALFVPGSEYFSALQGLCTDGCLAIEELIPVPPDFTGYEQTRVERPLVDQTPFNYSTKIAVLRVRKK
jgi:23S rRNA (cytosine1962-C5)-methyltransferase